MRALIERVKAMSDNDIMIIWRALRHYDPHDYYDKEQQITMDQWAEIIYSERSQRGLPLK